MRKKNGRNSVPGKIQLHEGSNGVNEKNMGFRFNESIHANIQPICAGFIFLHHVSFRFMRLTVRSRFFN